jgi:hypothetical protein
MCACVCACVRMGPCVYRLAGALACACMRACGLTQHAKRMRRIILSSVTGLAVRYFFRHYLINGAIFEGKSLSIKCVFWFSLQISSEKFLVVRRFQRDIVINVKTSSCKVHVILVRYLSFLDRVSEKLKYQLLSKSVQWEPSCSMWADRQTDMTKLIVAFRNFANPPKKGEIMQRLKYAHVSTETSLIYPAASSISLPTYLCSVCVSGHLTHGIWMFHDYPRFVV